MSKIYVSVMSYKNWDSCEQFDDDLICTEKWLNDEFLDAENRVREYWEAEYDELRPRTTSEEFTKLLEEDATNDSINYDMLFICEIFEYDSKEEMKEDVRRDKKPIKYAEMWRSEYAQELLDAQA